MASDTITPPPWAHYRATNKNGVDCWVGAVDGVGMGRAVPVDDPTCYMFVDLGKSSNVINLIEG